MKTAALIAIGTEVTDGQILNSNGQWLAQKLIEHHIPIVFHIAVPDDPALIKAALSFATQNADLFFLSGGLGPTSDDLTRDAVSSFLDKPLVFDPASWQEVQEKILTRGVTLREGHKQQCFFPQGAKTLTNSRGVAPGFYIDNNNKHFWVLPGPPKEIQAIWQDHISDQLNKNFLQDAEWILKTWMCAGIAESELAHLTEVFFAEKSFTKKIGYRLQSPSVEIKIWYPPGESIQALEAFEEFELKMKNLLVPPTT